MKYIISHILKLNENSGHTWIPYSELNTRVLSQLARDGHPLFVGTVKAFLYYFENEFYFDGHMSNIHGSLKAYFAMKDKIKFKEKDELYILGDIFDGNTNHPEECLAILDDIMANENIHLILGDHEYAHTMYYISKQGGGEAEEWESYLMNTEMNGEPLLHYIEENLSDSQKETYFMYLINCEISELIKIGDRYFYLVHGSPYVCEKKDFLSWQDGATKSEISIKKNYKMAVLSDPNLEIEDRRNAANAIIIVGHTPTKKVFESNKELLYQRYKKEDSTETLIEDKLQQILLYDSKMILHCGCSEDELFENKNGWINTLACVGIDSAGFFVEYLSEEDL